MGHSAERRRRSFVTAAAIIVLTTQPMPARPTPGLTRTATEIEPPAVNEAALASRLFDATQPSPGERAVIVFDPGYYPGITERLRNALHARGVDTYAIVEDTPAMVASYIEDDDRHNRRERDVVETWRPVFQRAQIFYWMPTRGYGDDLRWEQLVTENPRLRRVHFHWLLPFPGDRTPEEIVSASRARESAVLDIDLEVHARRQQRLADLMRGRTLRITTPAGTDLSVAVRTDEWFHFGNGNASRATLAAARWLRDRQIELPVGMFQFVPDSGTVSGVVVAPSVRQAGGEVRNVRLQIARGRFTRVDAASGTDWMRRRAIEIGPDGDRLGLVNINTHPAAADGVGLDFGANWENGASNRAVRMWRMSLPLRDAAMAIDGRTIMRDGRLLWDQIEQP
jgi:hypothetical protein